MKLGRSLELPLCKRVHKKVRASEASSVLMDEKQQREVGSC